MITPWACGSRLAWRAVPTGYAVNSDNTARTDPYTLFNLRLGYDYKPWNLGRLL